MQFFIPIHKLATKATGVGALLALPLGGTWAAPAAGAAGTGRAPATQPAAGRPTRRPLGSLATAALACTTPNNALNLDGTNDYVRSTGALPASSELTIETWVNPSAYPAAGDYAAILNGDNFVGGILHFELQSDGAVVLSVGGGVAGVSAFQLPLGSWSHVAAVYSSTSSTLTFYLNGVAQNTLPVTTNAGVSAQAYIVGGWNDGGTVRRFFGGSLNELRVWNTARTAAQLANTYSQALTAQRNLVLGYSFDQGTAGGTNTSTNTLTDNSGNTRNGTLTNFALTGTGSNWVAGNDFTSNADVASYSPTSGSPTANVTLSGTGLGAVTGVSFNGTPATFTLTDGTILVAQVPAGATSGPISFRTACGTQTVAGTFTMCTGPAATAQPASLYLSSGGTATVAATSLYTGPAGSNCGTFTIGAQKILSAYATEGNTITLTAPAGTTFTAVAFASYGAPIANSNGTYTVSPSCHAPNSQSVVEAAALGKNTFTIKADNNIFSDPCFGTNKALAIQVSYGAAQPAATLSFDCAEIGNNPVLLTVADDYGVKSTSITTVAVADVQQPGAGSGPLPAAPAVALANVPEAVNYGILYQLDAPNVAAFNQNGVPYGIDNSGAAVAKPGRVAYLVELTDGSSSKWVWTSMDNFAPTLAGLGLPNPTTNNVALHQNVSNLTVYASANAGVATGTNLGPGRIEMWHLNYLTGNADNVPGASASTYDFGDQVGSGASYGSFQVHNLAARQTVFAYNNWAVATNPGDLGIGSQVGGSGHPDWTFAYNAAGYSVKRITVLVPNVAVFLKPAALALPASGSLTLAASDIMTGPLSDNCGIRSTVLSPNTFTCTNLGANTVTLTLTDAAGNVTSGTTTVTVSVPAITSTTWNGNVSSDWTDCRNWSYGQMPTAAISAVLPGNVPNAPSVTTGTGQTKDINISGTNGLSLAADGTLNVYGSWVNTSSASSLAGTVAFVGSTNQTINQPGSLLFGRVAVNKPSGNLTLAQSMGVAQSLTLTSGVLTTGSFQAQLAPTATIAETETSYVTGNVATDRVLGSAADDFGGLGLVLAPASGSVAPGATTVVRTTGTTLSGNGTSKSIQRYFDIQPATNTGLNVDMTFSYFDHELNSIPKANLVLYKSESSPNGPWANMGGTSDVPNNRVLKTGLTDFSIWTLGNMMNPLPVRLLDFAAQPQGAAVGLSWHTASEKNSTRFDIERSLDGVAFAKLGTVAAQGTTTQAHAYAFRDAQLPAGANALYYRLRQVDADGTFAFSPVRTVRVADGRASAGLLALAPNPTHAGAALSGAPAGVAVQVLDALGRTVYATTTTAEGTATLALPAGLPGGVYIVRAGTQVARLTVE
ncbi:MAG TPA: LamG-like jellyroll fold domain-containing protein [Hymenobacter sp.]|uniref:LamG-like jellyroll fold domain-containing protein n=1 Tax=Hymenobacter sp. TaxID=1898978 RepID=UPI002D802EC1|nr:LamG-like jellyroll fold domain-containing protein [Hymenobacter sp.]HET9502620.1 LamG-like jellyroll fold domain-containing protein [Hymenobacter sp.]